MWNGPSNRMVQMSTFNAPNFQNPEAAPFFLTLGLSLSGFGGVFSPALSAPRNRRWASGSLYASSGGRLPIDSLPIYNDLDKNGRSAPPVYQTDDAPRLLYGGCISHLLSGAFRGYPGSRRTGSHPSMPALCGLPPASAPRPDCRRDFFGGPTRPPQSFSELPCDSIQRGCCRHCERCRVRQP
jgi:hypothetical protein